ncbi:MAG: DUF6888 family protein, partial [Dolichospermum sp.]
MFNPTAVQALTCLRVCQMVSNSFLDIHLIRFNEIKGYISRLALKIVVMTREQGTGNREQGTGNREQGTGNREQGTGNRFWAT